jgi:hypothetical protein
MHAEWILIFAALQVAAAPEQATYKLKATPKTVAWGYYAANTPPALRIRSGDSVEIEALITNSPARLEAAGVPPADVEPALRDIYREVTDKPSSLPSPMRITPSGPAQDFCPTSFRTRAPKSFRSTGRR